MTKPLGIYTVLYGLHAYLQIQQQGRLRYYQISLSLLYVLATAAIVIAILSEKQYNLFILALALNDDVNGPTVSGYIRSIENFKYVSCLTSEYLICYDIFSVASTAIYVTAK